MLGPWARQATSGNKAGQREGGVTRRDPWARGQRGKGKAVGRGATHGRSDKAVNKRQQGEAKGGQRARQSAGNGRGKGQTTGGQRDAAMYARRHLPLRPREHRQAQSATAFCKFMLSRAELPCALLPPGQACVNIYGLYAP